MVAETAAAKKKRLAEEAAAAVAEVNNEGEQEPHVEHELNIVQLISRISKEAGALAPESKGGVPFPFRGVDGTVNHLAPKLWKYGVVVVPKVLECTVTPTPQGNRVVKTAEVLTEFTFYAPDMTSITATTAGLADDYGDRATAQAQSVAYRIALLQTFSLPTQQPEPEETGQVVINGAEAAPAAPPQQPRAATTVQNAKQAPAEQTVEQVFLNLRAEAGKRNLTGAQMNKLAADAGATEADWIHNREILDKVTVAVKAIPVA